MTLLKNLAEMTPPDPPQNNYVVDHSGTRKNAGIVCDMLVGPCACGAWHKENE